MANKKVNQLTSKPAVNLTDLFLIADPTSGQAYKTTISDLGTAIGSGVSSVNSLVGAVVLDTDDIQELVSPTNKWFTDTRARAALSASSPLTYNSGTGVFGIQVANGSQNGYLSSTDWTTFNNKLSTATAASTYVPYTGATGNVNLGLDYSITAALIIKSGGTSTQFLKADGSIDTNTYALDSAVVKLTGSQTIAGTKKFTDSPLIDIDLGFKTTSGVYTYLGAFDAGWSLGMTSGINHLFYFGSTTARSYTFPNADGTIALTSNLSSYLPLSGGTLTGELNATGIKILGNSIPYIMSTLAGADLNIQFPVGQKLSINDNGATNVAYFSKTEHRLLINGSIALTVNSGGTSLNSALVGTTANFTGALSGTSATFTSGLIVSNTSDVYPEFKTSAVDADAFLGFSNTGDGNAAWSIGRRNTGEFWISTYTGNFNSGTRTEPLKIASTGAATFFTTDISGTRTNPLNILTLIGENGGAPYTGFGGSILFNNRSYTHGIVSSARIRSVINDNGDNTGGGFIFETTSTAGGTLTPTLTLSYTGAATFSNTLLATSLQIGGTGEPGKISLFQSSTKTYSSSTGNDTDLFVVRVNNSQTNEQIASLQLVASGNSGTSAGRAIINVVQTVPSANSGHMTFQTNDAGTIAERMRITSDGVALFGATALPSSSVSGVAIQNPRTLGPTLFSSGNVSDSRNFIQFINANGVVGSITTSGTSTSYNTSSDYRLKQDLKDFNGLNLVSNIKIYDYEWKSNKTRSYGVLAHELQEVLPDAVHGVKDGEQMQGVDYSKIVPVLIQSIKELKSKIETLENK